MDFPTLIWRKIFQYFPDDLAFIKFRYMDSHKIHTALDIVKVWLHYKTDQAIYLILGFWKIKYLLKHTYNGIHECMVKKSDLQRYWFGFYYIKYNSIGVDNKRSTFSGIINLHSEFKNAKDLHIPWIEKRGELSIADPSFLINQNIIEYNYTTLTILFNCFMQLLISITIYRFFYQFTPAIYY